MLMIVTSVQERPPFIPEAVHRKKQQMEVDAEPRRLERHIEEEDGRRVHPGPTESVHDLIKPISKAALPAWQRFPISGISDVIMALILVEFFLHKNGHFFTEKTT